MLAAARVGESILQHIRAPHTNAGGQKQSFRRLINAIRNTWTTGRQQVSHFNFPFTEPGIYVVSYVVFRLQR